MGNSLSPFAANFFMADFEQKIERDTRFPKFWCKYVDDIFAVCQSTKVNDILTWINSIQDTIKFTCEVERDDCIPFLDILDYNR
jgi:hypothetical protein